MYFNPVMLCPFQSLVSEIIHAHLLFKKHFLSMLKTGVLLVLNMETVIHFFRIL